MDHRIRPDAGHRAPAVGRVAARPSYLFVCDEWLPTTGGISVVNRELATAVALRGHRTTCLVRSATPVELADAAGRGVRLVLAERTPFGPDLHLLVTAVLDDPPDVVVGHDRITGHIAWLYARRFGHARLVHLVHTAPAEIEPYKDRDGAALRTEERETSTQLVAREADVVAAVGPRLARAVAHLLDDGYGGVPVLRLDPGLDVGLAEVRPRVPPGQPTVLALGRTADIALKGLDIAAGAVAALPLRPGRPAPVLVVRGAPAALCEQVRNALVATSGLARGRVDVRPYVADPTAIRRNLLRSALCVMPSRSEGFGLVAWEAVALGTPVLISAQSGAAELLWEHLGPTAASMIVEVTDDLSRDIPAWSAAVRRVLDDLPAAFTHAHRVRNLLADRLSWTAAAEVLRVEVGVRGRTMA